MNFFEHQDRAKRNAGVMVLVFLVAVLVVLAFTNALGAAVHAFLSPGGFAGRSWGRIFVDAPAWVYQVASAATIAVIAFGTWARMAVLAEGGVGLARLIGARRLSRASREPAEQRLLNVVEEMAIAAGINVPEAFVLEGERGVNALAAGHAPNEAAVIVTRGALERLGRDELQGMMAHEFSHILNGDIRLNLRVLGVISGITLVGGIGRAYVTNHVLFIVALPLWVIGSIGMLAGRVIRAALSREREFLADAAAVQFTRNPGGIAAALHKMRQYGAAVGERHSEELEHMYLGEPRRFQFAWLSSHPPVEARIERILGPRWRLDVHAMSRRDALAAAPKAEPPAAVRTTALALLGSVGQLTHAHYELARRLLASLPPGLREACGTQAGAAAALYALLLAQRATRDERLEALRARAGGDAADEAGRLAGALDGLDPRLHLPLFELAVPMLKESTPAVRAAILDTALALVAARRNASLHDFVLLTLCRRHLGEHRPGPMPEKYQSLVPVTPQVVTVVSLLVHAAAAGEGAFHRAMTHLGFSMQRLRPAQELDFAAVEKALYELKLLAAPRKAQLVQACLGVVIADQSISVVEGELMRAICAAIESPLPPLIAEAA